MRKVLALFFIGALSASQGWAALPLDQLLACRRIADSAARLDCFDHASDAALANKQPEAVVTPPEQVAIQSTIVQVLQPLSGPAEFTLENGQVWRQSDGDNARSAKIGDRVEVTKKHFGAFWLKVQGGRGWRVTLIRPARSG